MGALVDVFEKLLKGDGEAVELVLILHMPGVDRGVGIAQSTNQSGGISQAADVRLTLQLLQGLVLPASAFEEVSNG